MVNNIENKISALDILKTIGMVGLGAGALYLLISESNALDYFSNNLYRDLMDFIKNH